MEIWKLFVLMMIVTGPEATQTVEVRAKPLSDADVQLIRQDVQSEKNQIITHTMTFTESEAAAFWPVYREYAAEQHAIGTKRLNLIVDYAQNLDKLNDDKTRNLSQRMLAVDDDVLNLRKRYYPRFEKALGAKRAAKFYQVDSRLTLIINLQMSSQIPLIP